MYSNLIDMYVDFGTKKSDPRKNDICKITPHHMASRMSAMDCAIFHRDGNREASANYYIGNDGEMVGGVSEYRRAWSTSNPGNDHQAINIEVANEIIGGNWKISDKAYHSLVMLCAEICRRYHIVPHFTGTKDGTITTHDMFYATACPGAYLKGIIASGKFETDIVNILNNEPITPGGDEVKTTEMKVLFYNPSDIMTGEAVRVLQSIVIPWEIDGSFGQRTEKAVKDFQTKNKIEVDGIVGTETWGKILEHLKG